MIFINEDNLRKKLIKRISPNLKQVAEGANIDYANLNRWKNGKPVLGVKQLIKLKEYLRK